MKISPLAIRLRKAHRDVRSAEHLCAMLSTDHEKSPRVYQHTTPLLDFIHEKTGQELATDFLYERE